VRKIALFVLVFVCFSFCFASNVYYTQVENAERNFKEGNFSKTIEIYESLIEIEKIQDPNVYYNLSNAYYRNGDIGKAILNIEKAFKFAPRDKEIKGNMKFLYSLVEHSKEQSIKDIFIKHFTLNEITMITSILLVLLFSILALLIIKRKPLFKNLVLFFLLLLFFCFSVLILKWCQEITLKEAVILSSVSARSGPGENNPEIFTISEGKFVSVVARNGAWVNIRFRSKGEDFIGWIPSNDVGSINE
jgi:ABC-type sugar transport system permease subunit